MKFFEFQNDYYNRDAIARVYKWEDTDTSTPTPNALPYAITLTYMTSAGINHFFKSKEERDNAWTDLIAEL